MHSKCITNFVTDKLSVSSNTLPTQSQASLSLPHASLISKVTSLPFHRNGEDHNFVLSIEVIRNLQV